MSDQGWFSDTDPDMAPSDTYQWQPCLQVEGLILSFDVWYSSKADCDDFIRRTIIGKGMLPDTP